MRELTIQEATLVSGGAYIGNPRFLYELKVYSFKFSFERNELTEAGSKVIIGIGYGSNVNGKHQSFDAIKF